MGWELLRELLAQWIWVVLSLAGAAMLAFLRSYWPRIADPLLVTVIIFAALATSVMVFKFNAFLQTQRPIETQNIEITLRRWADDFGWGTRRTDVEGAHFAFSVALTEGVNLVVLRDIRLDRYITVVMNLRLNDAQKAAFAELDEPAASDLLSNLRIEMARLQMEYANITVPLAAIRIQRQIPITTRLADHDFLTAIQQVNMARVLATETIVARLRN